MPINKKILQREDEKQFDSVNETNYLPLSNKHLLISEKVSRSSSQSSLIPHNHKLKTEFFQPQGLHIQKNNKQFWTFATQSDEQLCLQIQNTDGKFEGDPIVIGAGVTGPKGDPGSNYLSSTETFLDLSLLRPGSVMTIVLKKYASYISGQVLLLSLDKDNYLDILVDSYQYPELRFEVITIHGNKKGHSWFINLKGIKGPLGPTGAVGNEGMTGPKGDLGPRGIMGPTGSMGVIGLQGPMGLPGPQGIQGEIGNTGPRGEKGNPGPIGPLGLTGYCGPTGPRGFSGPQGEMGKQGPMGFTGPRGFVGIQGKQGIEGQSK